MISPNALSSWNVSWPFPRNLLGPPLIIGLAVCNGPTKCVFVRKVDTCAGCAPGSHHVDLTKAAFTQLADLSEGVLNVQMREASDPDEWFEDLWGPQN